jgi:hypothetical protein
MNHKKVSFKTLTLLRVADRMRNEIILKEEEMSDISGVLTRTEADGKELLKKGERADTCHHGYGGHWGSPYCLSS